MEDIFKSKTCEINGIKWHWIEAGSGEPVILLHGNSRKLEMLETSNPNSF